MSSRALTGYDGERLRRIADSLAVAVAVSLPWSTTATGILIVLWLVAARRRRPGGDCAAYWRSRPAGFRWRCVLLGIVGMLWATGVSLGEQLYALKGFHKLHR